MGLQDMGVAHCGWVREGGAYGTPKTGAACLAEAKLACVVLPSSFLFAALPHKSSQIATWMMGYAIVATWFAKL